MKLSRITRRAETLAAYNILDTDAEGVFDQLTRLVCGIFQAPISTLTFLDRNRQWFKSRVGVPFSEAPLSHSLCVHAADHPEGILVIGDALRDERFWNHPAVTDDPYLRFYVGVPLIMRNGESIGTICAADRRPREITTLERDALCCLRDFAVTILEARRNAEANQRHEHHVRHLQRLLPICTGCGTHRLDETYHDALDDYLMVMKHRLDANYCPHCAPREALVG
jgi:GAF domain-containing protein